MDNANPLSKNAKTGPNPLANYYRRPGIYITLPSGGRFYKIPPKMSETSELAVYPMTAKDELILKNPDALLNGEALRQVIASICPDIKNVDEIPAPDIDTILVAMRLTSYGDELNIEVQHNGCTKSEGKSQKVSVGLGSVLATMKEIPTNVGEVLLSSGVKVSIKPYTLFAQSRLLRVQFSTMRELQAAEQNEKISVSEKADIVNSGYNKLIALSQETLAESIYKVLLPDGVEVTNSTHISDWIKNLDRASIGRLEQELKGFGEFGIFRTINVKCEHCSETYTSDMLFDPTSFFGIGS